MKIRKIWRRNLLQLTTNLVKENRQEDTISMTGQEEDEESSDEDDDSQSASDETVQKQNAEILGHMLESAIDELNNWEKLKQSKKKVDKLSKKDLLKLHNQSMATIQALVKHAFGSELYSSEKYDKLYIDEGQNEAHQQEHGMQDASSLAFSGGSFTDSVNTPKKILQICTPLAPEVQAELVQELEQMQKKTDDEHLQPNQENKEEDIDQISEMGIKEVAQVEPINKNQDDNKANDDKTEGKLDDENKEDEKDISEQK